MKSGAAGETEAMVLRPLALVLALAAPAFADETPTPPRPTLYPSPTLDPKEQATLQNFGAANSQCREWSDGCAVCQRDDAVHCSLPGIACQPAEIACKTP